MVTQSVQEYQYANLEPQFERLPFINDLAHSKIDAVNRREIMYELIDRYGERRHENDTDCAMALQVVFDFHGFTRLSRCW
jgi:hypothetical protein